MRIVFAALFGLLAFSSFATAQNAPRDQINMGKTQASSSSQSLNLGPKKFSLSTPEIRCYSIRRITLVDESPDGAQSSSQFYWALDRAKAALQLKLPHCLGDQGLNLLTKQIQTEINAGGSTSVRVIKPEQDLHSGSLVLNVLLSGKQNSKKGNNSSSVQQSNKKKEAVYTDGFRSSVSNKNPQATAQYEAALKKVKEKGEAIVVTANRNVNQEGVKTTRQSIVKANTAARATTTDVSVISSATQGAATRKSTAKVKAVAMTEKNDGKLTVKGQVGVKGATASSDGKWQAEAQLSISNILAYNDRLKATVSHSTKPKKQLNSKANSNASIEYEVPFGDWNTSIAYKDDSVYREVFAGENRYITHSGKSKSANLAVSYKLYEDEQRKTTVSASVWTRQSKSDTVDIASEKYRLAGWAASLAHQEMLGDAIISAKAAYKQAVSYKMNNADTAYRPRIISAELGLRKPFSVMDESFYFDSAWKAQWSKKALHLDDQFAVGGLDTVRGFSGNQVIAGTKGWVGRNELGWNIQEKRYTLYTALDVGKVSRDNIDGDKIPTLVGGTLGLKGEIQSFNYDFFVAKAFSRPKGFKVPKYLIGANVSYRF